MHPKLPFLVGLHPVRTPTNLRLLRSPLHVGRENCISHWLQGAFGESYSITSTSHTFKNTIWGQMRLSALITRHNASYQKPLTPINIPGT
jgi:hypothetical protein